MSDPVDNNQINSCRTLNVRDALSYLDQVKLRFQDQNDVYDQFLEVMKLFKTQSIDTPGVIERVSTLFRGYPSLIQGFNTFLPPGFRIECTLITRIPPNPELADLVTVYTPGEITHRTSLFPRDGTPAIVLTDHPIGSLPSGWIHLSTDPQSLSNDPSAHPNLKPSPAPNLLSPKPIPRITPPSDHVRSNLSIPSKPLASILKPANPIITPHPSNLEPSGLSTKSTRSHHPRSTTPLNQQHPGLTGSGKKPITAHEPSPSNLKYSSTATPHPPPNSPSPRGTSPSIDGLGATLPMNAPQPGPVTEYSVSNRLSNLTQSQQASSSGRTVVMEHDSPPKLTVGSDLVKPHPSKPARLNSNLALAINPSASNLNTKPVEFNYAINYVNKIKHRFIDQPEVYKTFLEILQTYQRNGMPIDSVYVKVTKLFATATDLLDEFKQFLPDLNAGPTVGQVSKPALPPPPSFKTNSSRPHPNTSPQSSQSSNSTSKPSIDKSIISSSSQPLPFTGLAHPPESVDHASPSPRRSDLKTDSNTTRHQRSQSSMQPHAPNDPIHDSTTHLTRRASSVRSQSPQKTNPNLTRVASATGPMVLDPQVLSSTASRSLDPQVLNHPPSNSKLPISIAPSSTGGTPSSHGCISSTAPSARTCASHHLGSVPAEPSPSPHQKRSLVSPKDPVVTDDEVSGPPRKRRALFGVMSNVQLEDGQSVRINEPAAKVSNEPNPITLPSDGSVTTKTKRSRSKTTTSVERLPPTVTHEAVQHKITSFLEQYRSSQVPSHDATITEPVHPNSVGLSEDFKDSSYGLHQKTIDPSIGGATSYLHPHVQIVQDPYLLNPTLTDHSTWQPSYVETHNAMGGRTLTNTKELTLFESIKRYLDDPEVWLEFLRVLDLYNRSIIDFKTLIERVSVFIGDDDDLLEDFKGLVGYEIKNDGLVEGEVWEIKNRELKEREKVDASTIRKEYGPSYKRLPRAEIDLACSGRDELCWSVLNDEYFGAARFGTESGGPGHRKTNFEEVIAMTEGERAHFSYWLDCISRTIGHLESLQVRIDGMEDRVRAEFTLGDQLGGMSPSIYHRTLRKVYDHKYQTSILPYLRDHPAKTIPIVLRRLKELELSWKSAESQWNLIWREVERKNYYKAQDHQVIGFKSNEKSLLKGQNVLKEIHELKKSKKSLVHTITIREPPEDGPDPDQDLTQATQLDPTTTIGLGHPSPSDPSTRPKLEEIDLESQIPEKVLRSPKPSRSTHQVELGFEDIEVFFDVLRIVIMALDRSALSNPERRRIDESIRTFIPAIWNISSAEFEKRIPIIYDDESSEPSEDGHGGGRRRRRRRVSQAPDRDETSTPKNDRKTLLDQNGIETLTEGLLKIQNDQTSGPNHSRGTTRASQNLDDTPISSPSQSYQPTPVELMTNKTTCSIVTATSAPHLPGNHDSIDDSTMASFTGLKKWTQVSIIDSITCDGHEHDASDPNDSVQPVDFRMRRWYNTFGTSTYYLLIRSLHTLYSRLLRLKTIGLELGNHKPRWRRINPVALELGLSHSIIGLDDHPDPSSQLYPYCLDQLSRYFDGEIDVTSFEESIRVAFPRDGYVLSTIDKLTNSILKQFAQIHQEPRNKELLNLLKRERIFGSSQPVTQIAYRSQAETMMEEEGELFHAEWHPERMSLSVQILYEGESTFEVKTAADRLIHYVDTYEYETKTESIDRSKVRTPFLRAGLMRDESEEEAESSEDSEDHDEHGPEEVQGDLDYKDKTCKRKKNHFGVATKNQKNILEGGHSSGVTSSTSAGSQVVPDTKEHLRVQLLKKSKRRRETVLNENKIKLFIDPTTYQLKFHHPPRRRPRQQRQESSGEGEGDRSETDGSTGNSEDRTDILFVRELHPPRPLWIEARIDRFMNRDRQRRFETWFSNRQRELDDLHRSTTSSVDHGPSQVLKK